MFHTGFHARALTGTMSLEDHVYDYLDDPYVSTSYSEWVALSFIAHESGWLYKIRTNATRVSTNGQLGLHAHSNAMEVAVFRRIPAEDIESATQIFGGRRLLESRRSERDGQEAPAPTLRNRLLIAGRRDRVVEGVVRGRTLHNPNFRPD